MLYNTNFSFISPSCNIAYKYYIKKEAQQMSGESPFGFLKGNDKEFDAGMKSIDSMYTNLFNDDKLNDIFKTFETTNNPITEPINEMSREVFETDKPAKGPKYVKEEPIQGDIVIGEPIQKMGNNYHYQHPQQPHPHQQHYPNLKPYV